MKSDNVNGLMLGGLFIVWSIPVLNFIINPSYHPKAWPVWFAMSVTFLLTLADSRLLAFSIPFVAMISPLADSGRFMGLLLSELFLAYCTLYWISIHLFKSNLLFIGARLRLLPGDLYLVGLVCISLISYLLSFEYSALFPSFLNWIALIIVFAITRTYLRSTKLVYSYMVSLLVVAGFISVLIVVSFINGMSLVNFMTEYDNIFLEQDKLNYLYRASFYYTNILFVVGPVAIISLVAMFTADTIIYKLIFMGLLLMLFSTLFIMFAKTAFVTLAITLLILAFIYFSNRKYYKINNRVTQYLFLFFMLLFQMGVINMLANTSDFYELRPDSFSQRLIVASSAFETLSMHPENFFFGYGPDSSIRLISDTMDSARFSGESIEGAIDSTYVTILFEYGFVFMFLFLIFGVHTLLRLFWCIKRNAKMQHILITLFSVIIFIYIAAISQRIGTSKVAWIIVQIFALAGICLTQNINNQSHIKSHL